MLEQTRERERLGGVGDVRESAIEPGYDLQGEPVQSRLDVGAA